MNALGDYFGCMGAYCAVVEIYNRIDVTSKQVEYCRIGTYFKWWFQNRNAARGKTKTTGIQRERSARQREWSSGGVAVIVANELVRLRTGRR